MSKRKALILPVIILGLLEIFFVIMMLVFWGRIVHPVGAAIFGIILTVFFIMYVYYFIHPEKYYSDDVKKFNSQLFGCDIEVEAENVSKEYVNACIRFFDKIKMSLIVEKSHEDFERFKEVGTFDGIEDMEEQACDEGILDFIKMKIMHIGAEHGQDPNAVWFIAEGEAEWCEGFEIVVADGKVVHIGEFSGDYNAWIK